MTTAIRIAALLASTAIVAGSACLMAAGQNTPRPEIQQLPRVVVTGTVHRPVQVIDLPRVVVTGRAGFKPIVAKLAGSGERS